MLAVTANIALLEKSMRGPKLIQNPNVWVGVGVRTCLISLIG
jgi:hypothetical protein